jgi:hypothetical protein
MVADGINAPPPRRQTLFVPSGSEMIFRYGGQRPPTEVSATTYTLFGKVDTNGGGWGDRVIFLERR